MSALKSAAMALTLVAVLLVVAGFIIPPTGVIDGSVLTAAGELLGFVSLFLVWRAVELGRTAEFTHGNTTARINGDDDD